MEHFANIFSSCSNKQSFDYCVTMLPVLQYCTVIVSHCATVYNVASFTNTLCKILCFCNLYAVLETRLEKLLVRGESKLKKVLAPLKSSLSSYFEGVRGQSIKLIMLYFTFRFPQGFVWVCIG